VRWIGAVAFCGMSENLCGELVPIVPSIGVDSRVRGNTNTRFINDFVL
jgi:hypothetical protein